MKIKNKINKWGDSLCSWIKRFNTVKTSVLPNLIYRFNAILIKIAASYFMGIDNLIIKIIWRCKRPRIANSILKKNKVGGPTLPGLKTYCKAIRV